MRLFFLNHTQQKIAIMSIAHAYHVIDRKSAKIRFSNI